MRFIVDAQLPPALARMLCDSGIVWSRIGNTSRSALLKWFEPLLPKIESLIDQGDRLIEVK